MSLEDYLKKEFGEGKIDFRIRVNVTEPGIVSFYIHPANKDGATADFVVHGNTLSD